MKAEGHYDAAAKTYTLTLSQSCPATPGQPHKEPFVIPVQMGLVGADGRDLPLQLLARGDRDVPGGERAEAGRDAVVRDRVVGQPLDDGA